MSVQCSNYSTWVIASVIVTGWRRVQLALNGFIAALPADPLGFGWGCHERGALMSFSLANLIKITLGEGNRRLYLSEEPLPRNAVPQPLLVYWRTRALPICPNSPQKLSYGARRPPEPKSAARPPPGPLRGGQRREAAPAAGAPLGAAEPAR